MSSMAMRMMIRASQRRREELEARIKREEEHKVTMERINKQNLLNKEFETRLNLIKGNQK